MNVKKYKVHGLRPKVHGLQFKLHGSTHGQFEIMGLAVIVILVTLGVLFALSTLTGPETSLQQTFEQKRLVVDFIKASLDTQAPQCAKASLRELFQDCAQAQSIACNVGTPSAPVSKSSCQFLKETYKTLFAQTFEKYRQKYLFDVVGTAGSCGGSFVKLCEITQGNIPGASGPGRCPGEREITSQPLPTRAGPITITLEICG